MNGFTPLLNCIFSIVEWTYTININLLLYCGFQILFYKMLLFWSIIMSLITYAFTKFCDAISCSNVIDYVCGNAISRDGTEIIMKYHNICHMRKTDCELEFMTIHKVPDKYCNINSESDNVGADRTSLKSKYLSHRVGFRRVNDFSIVGAHQACNHSCPTYCSDIYDPACAQIWKRNSKTKSTTKPMINHCHIDMLSCSSGLNVTIHPLSKCYKNPSGLMFMMQIAAINSLKLLDNNTLIS